MNYCPCCSGLLLPHIRSSQIYWFCRHCWQDMPVFFSQEANLLSETVSGQLLDSPHQGQKINIKVYANKQRNISYGWIRIQELLA